MSHSVKPIILASAAGLVVGAAVGMVCAPKKGKKLRKMVLKKIQQLREGKSAAIDTLLNDTEEDTTDSE
jgi:gas vesicle protein